MLSKYRSLTAVTIITLILFLLALPAGAANEVSLALSETTFSPNGDGFRDTTVVWFKLTGNAKTTVRVLRNGAIVATLHRNANLNAGPHAFIWGGTSGLLGGAPLPDGRYTLQVVAKYSFGTYATAGDFYILRHLIGPGGIENGAVTRDKIAFGAIDGARIADGTIGMDKLATITVVSGNIGDGAVSAGKLEDGAVTNAKLAFGSVDSDKIADGTISTADIKDGAITGVKITPGTITQTQINSTGLNADTLDGKHATDFDSADAAEVAARIAADAADAAAWASADTADAAAWAAADTADAAAWAAADNANALAWAAADTSETAARIAGDNSLWTALGNATATLNSNFTTLSNQHTADVSAMQAALATETTNRQSADANHLDTSALASGLKFNSGEITISTSLIGDATSTISFGGAFISPPPILLIGMTAMSDPIAKVINMRASTVSTDTGEVTLRVDANGSGTGVATIRWLAIGN